MTTMRMVEFAALPVICFILIVVALRCIWPSPPKEEKAAPSVDPEKATEKSALTGSADGTTDYAAVTPTAPVVREAGEARGDYSAPWGVVLSIGVATMLRMARSLFAHSLPPPPPFSPPPPPSRTETFDLTFLIIWCVLLGAVAAWTFVTAPALFSNPVFWFGNLVKLAIMCGVSLIGGAMCRWFCKVDENGYILTSKASWFKVNYTRKFQHFAAYAVPLLVHMKGQDSMPGSTILHLAWGDVFTLLGFLVLIKPVREMKIIGTPFMMMFNSLDRPEDRPDCLKWIIGGNILPGLFIIIGFHLLYAQAFEPLQAQLVMIFVLVAGVGDGLAEPVGIYFGTHKYKTRSCTSSDLYTRSLEGSACVFLTTFIWIIMFADCFPHESQFWILMVVLPPVMAFAEATSPHTMDTPVLMILGGLLIYLDLRFTACYAGNHGGLRC